MYVTIDQTDYTVLHDLAFSPETDFTGDTVPINEFSVQIVTTDDITIGQYAELHDDLDNLWAKYWITYAERASADSVLIKARSDIAILDGVTLPATMYTAEPIGDLLDSIMIRNVGAGLTGTVAYSLDGSFSSTTLTGFCPEQSARERLQWVCFVIGAYVKTFFNDEIEILPIDSTTVLVPIWKTFFKPTINYSDHVTGVKVTGYSFAQGTPQTTDEYVTDGTNYYIVTKQEYTLANSLAPAAAADNVVTVDGVYLVNSGNVSGILTHLAALYFKRTEVELDVIDNAEYIPGDKLTVYADVDMLLSGFAKSCEFAFGVQARAKMVLTASESVTGAKLTIVYTWNSTELDREEYFLPAGYSYSITTRYLDATMNGHRYVFRPTTATISGTMPSAGTTETVTCEVALDLHQGILHVISVDEVTVDSSGDDAIGVIA